MVGEALGGNQPWGYGAMPRMVGANFAENLGGVFAVGSNECGDGATKVCGQIGLCIANFGAHASIGKSGEIGMINRVRGDFVAFKLELFCLCQGEHR